MNNNVRNAIIIVALVVLLGLGGFVFINSSSRNIMKKNMNTVINLAGDVIEEANEEMEKVKDKSIEADCTTKLNLDLSDNILTTPELKTFQTKLNSSTISYKVGVDQKNKFIQLALKFGMDNKDLIDFDMSIKDDKSYFKLKDVIDSYLEMPLDETLDMSYETVDIYDDVEVIYDAVSPVVRDELLKGKITSSKETINVDGKDIKVKKNTLLIDEKLYLTTANEIYKAIKADDKVLDSMVAILKTTDKEITKEEVVEDIDNEIKNNEERLEILQEDADEEDTDEIIYLTIYTKGIFNKPVQYILTNYEGDAEVSLSLLGKSKYLFEYAFDDKQVFSIKGTCTKNNCDLEYSFINPENDAKFTGTMLINSEESKSGEKAHIEFTIDTGKELIGAIGITADIGAKYVDSITAPDFSTAITTEDLTMDVYDKAKAKLQEIIDAFEFDIDAEDLLLGLMYGSTGLDMGSLDEEF